MGAWMLVILVMSILVSLTSQDRKPGSGSNTAQTPTAVVSNSGWDGSVHQVERYLKQNLKDPSSFEAIEWSPVVKGADVVDKIAAVRTTTRRGMNDVPVDVVKIVDVKVLP